MGQVIGSLVGFTLLYGFLGIADIFLLTKFARKGPADAAAPSTGKAA
jgi:cytochrome d ubiquinol oxidase subunit I